MASVPDSSLKAGLAALKQGDYPTAIAQLEACCQGNLNRAAQVKAQMGLVIAYELTKEISRAIALCQALGNSPEPQVREWAVDKQAELKNLHPVNLAAPESDVTGFVAFDSPPVRDQRSGDRGQESVVNSRPSPQRFANASLRLRLTPSADAPRPNASLRLRLTPLAQLRQAGRAKRWQLLPKINLIPLWLLQVGTATLLFWLIRELLKLAMVFTNDLLVKLPYLEPIQLFYRDPTQFVLLTLTILISLSPWLLDKLLWLLYGLQPLSLNTLSNHSPEAIRVLQRYCRQRKWSLPQLGILSTSAPMALTYGNLPRTARIVVSQGLLEQLADDEIATIYASQLGHIAHWDFAVMSLVMLVTQLPYIVYQQVSQWGDQITNVIFRSTAAVIASLAYGVWWLLSKSALWLSQLRIYYSDRLAAEITGNPNALTRALLKIAQGIANNIQQHGYTSSLLESLDLLTPISYHQAIIAGSFHSSTEFEAVFGWDCVNSARYWLNINNSHPLIGDRLQRLNRTAQHWHLETELNLLGREGSLVNSRHSPPIPHSLLLLQAAPFFGIALGLAFGWLIWLIGGIGILLRIPQLAWMYGDWAIIKGCLPIGFSIGTFVRINSFFPDLKSATVQTEPSLNYLLTKPSALPVDSQPVLLKGKLLGRHGISNSLGQDVILHSPNGFLVKLHHLSWLGPIGNLLLFPTDLVGQDLIATGWFRRGATSWIDIDTLRTQHGRISHSAHPVWSTLLASAAAAWGASIILWGSI